MKILILKPSSLGDIIQALPVLRLLRLHYPKAEIHWWVDSALAGLLEDDRDLTGIVRFERQRWRNPRHWPEVLDSLRAMRAQKFDVVIDLQSLLRSAAFGWLSRGKFFLGLDGAREGARFFYNESIPRASFTMHAVDWYLSVLPRLGVPVHEDYDWLPERPAVAAAIKARWNLAGTRWLLVQPGARWDNKRWPEEHFTALVSRLVKEFTGRRVAVMGGSADRELGERIAKAAPDHCLNLCGKTSLPEMIEWVRLAELMITNDTGPMHVAAALGKPVVGLFGPTAPERTGPYHQINNVVRLKLPCSPCLKATCHYVKPNECLRGITVENVLARTSTLMSPKPVPA